MSTDTFLSASMCMASRTVHCTDKCSITIWHRSQAGKAQAWPLHCCSSNGIFTKLFPCVSALQCCPKYNSMMAQVASLGATSTPLPAPSPSASPPAIVASPSPSSAPQVDPSPQPSPQPSPSAIVASPSPSLEVDPSPQPSPSPEPVNSPHAEDASRTAPASLEASMPSPALTPSPSP